MPDAPYMVEPAKSSRSKCKACKGEINKDQLRFGTLLEVVSGHGTYSWRCLACITAKQCENVISKVGSADSVDGYDALAAAGQKEFMKAFEKAQGKAAGAAKAKPKAKEKAKARAKAASSAPPSVKEQHDFLDLAKAFKWTEVKACVEKNAGFVNAQPAGRWTALHQAAQKGNVAMVKYLLSKGARTDLKTKDGQVAADVAKGDETKALLAGAGKKRAAGDASGGTAKKKAGAAAGGKPVLYCSSENPLDDLGLEEIAAEEKPEVKQLSDFEDGDLKELAERIAEQLEDVTFPAGESDSTPLAFIIQNPRESLEDSIFEALGLAEKNQEDNDIRAAMNSKTGVEWDDDTGFLFDGDEDGAEDADEEVTECVSEVTSIMKEELENHFEVNATDALVTAPVVWGGFKDGCMVGVLCMRVWT